MLAFIFHLSNFRRVDLITSSRQRTAQLQPTPMGPTRRWGWRFGDEGFGQLDRRTAVSNTGASSLHQMSGSASGARTSRRCPGRGRASQWPRQLVIFCAANVRTRY